MRIYVEHNQFLKVQPGLIPNSDGPEINLEISEKLKDIVESNQNIDEILLSLEKYCALILESL